MKKYILLIVLLLITSQVYGLTANEYWARRTNLGAQNRDLDPLYELVGDVDDVLGTDGVLEITTILFANETGDPTATEGSFYYNATSEVLRLRKSGSWVNLAVESGTVSLDIAYNNGNSIDVDGSAVTLTTSDTDNNVVLAIVQAEGTNNNDGVTISQTGTGDALQINPQDVDSGGLKVLAKAAGILPLAILDGATGAADWDGADNIGKLQLRFR